MAIESPIGSGANSVAGILRIGDRESNLESEVDFFFFFVSKLSKSCSVYTIPHRQLLIAVAVALIGFRAISEVVAAGGREKWLAPPPMAWPLAGSNRGGLRRRDSSVAFLAPLAASATLITNSPELDEWNDDGWPTLSELGFLARDADAGDGRAGRGTTPPPPPPPATP